MPIKLVCLILGGGAGTRLYPLTQQRSKPAVPVGGKYRLIDIPISNCINSGVKRMFVLTQFNSASLNRHIKNTYHFDAFNSGFVDILAAEQTPNNPNWFQGTADAVRQSMHHLANQDFDYILILSGDQLYQMNFEELAQSHIDMGADLTIATIPVDASDAPDFGIMKVDENGWIPRFIEKPKKDVLKDWTSEVSAENTEKGKIYLASMGIYIFNRATITKLFEENPDATDFGKEIIPAAINGGAKVGSFQFDSYWTDIGNIRSFFEANLELTDNIPKFNLFDNNELVYTRPRMLAPAKIHGTQLDRVVLSEGSIIHAKRIEHCVIGIRSRVGKGSVVTNTIIMGNDYFQTLNEIALQKDEILMGVGENCVIDHAILDKNCCIGDNVIIKGSTELSNIETPTYCIVDGIVVLKKGAVIPSGSRIGLVEETETKKEATKK